MDLPVTATEVELTIVTRDEEHCRQLLAAMDERGYPCSGSTRAAPAERHGPAGPVVHAAVQNRSRVDTGCGENACRDAGAHPGLADRHDRLLRVDAVGPKSRKSLNGMCSDPGMYPSSRSDFSRTSSTCTSPYREQPLQLVQLRPARRRRWPALR